RSSVAARTGSRRRSTTRRQAKCPTDRRRPGAARASPPARQRGRIALMRALRALDNIEQLISNLCLAALVVVLGLQIVFRYVLGIGLSWSEEVSRFLFIWFVYVSASLAARAGTHVRVTAFVDMLPPRAGHLVRIAADLIWIGFNAI